ncbi:unnamed protein product [Prorocentrum cordatum]|uniref:Uncharacterized protein n=1 Tax=Prorocentrum cordatum TaxID=2364126 RepID=A0ABN9U210_9DINO|nr:unnamed protein product [Polarella glacialis]
MPPPIATPSPAMAATAPGGGHRREALVLRFNAGAREAAERRLEVEAAALGAARSQAEDLRCELAECSAEKDAAASELAAARVDAAEKGRTGLRQARRWSAALRQEQRPASTSASTCASTSASAPRRPRPPTPPEAAPPAASSHGAAIGVDASPDLRAPVGDPAHPPPARRASGGGGPTRRRQGRAPAWAPPAGSSSRGAAGTERAPARTGRPRQRGFTRHGARGCTGAFPSRFR